MQALWWCRLLDFLRVQWKNYKSTFGWLLVWLIAGGVLGIVTLIVGDIGTGDINYRLIDGNILNATAIGSSIGGFIWQRILSIMIPIIVVFVLAALSRLTACAIFPVVFMHGYWLTIAVWWVFLYYSFTAILLLAFYTVWLILVTAILFAGLVWAWQWGSHCRTCEQNRRWGTILRGTVILIVIAVVLGFFEYLVFWTILGKIVYKPV